MKTMKDFPHTILVLLPEGVCGNVNIGDATLTLMRQALVPIDDAEADIIQRYSKKKFNVLEQPTYLYSFTVSGHGRFPWAMLREAEAWPADSTSVWQISREVGERSIALCSYKHPEFFRWQSYGWKLGL